MASKSIIAVYETGQKELDKLYFGKLTLEGLANINEAFIGKKGKVPSIDKVAFHCLTPDCKEEVEKLVIPGYSKPLDKISYLLSCAPEKVRELERIVNESFAAGGLQVGVGEFLKRNMKRVLAKRGALALGKLCVLFGILLLGMAIQTHLNLL